MQVGYHASHEQHPPGRLLRYVQMAEEAGFDAAMCSDHLMPFTASGHSGFAWSWLGAALQATSLPLGVVTAPGNRYHPAIIAQAAATLAEMYSGRFWLALGSGELLNEHITGEWPTKAERQARLVESADIIRMLWAAERVDSRIVPTDAAGLYVLPARPPLIVGAAVSAETAAFVAPWADALITVAAPLEGLRETVRAFRCSGGESKPMYLQAQLSYAETGEAARRAACENWRVAALPSDVMAELKLPEDLDAAAAGARDEEILRSVRASADLDQHAAWLNEYADLGFDAVYLHNVQADDEPFISAFGHYVLPRVKR